MDPQNVVILNNGFNISDNNCNGVFKNYKVINCEDTADFQFMDWNKTNIFYVHNTSKNIKEFPVNCISSITDYLTKKYGFTSENRIMKHECPLKSFWDENATNLFITAVAVVKKQFINLLYRHYQKKEYNLKEFVGALVYNSCQIKLAYNSALADIPSNSSHFIFTILYKYKNEKDLYDSKTYHIIQSRNLDNMAFTKNLDIVERNIIIHNIVDEITNILINSFGSLANIAIFIYIDKSTVLKDSEHVFKFMDLICRPQQPVKSQLTETKTKDENRKLKCEIIRLQQKYKNVVRYMEKEKDNVKRITSMEVKDKLSESHQKILDNQRDNYESIITRTKENNEKKIFSVTEFYENQNNMLRTSLTLYEQRLSNIQNSLLGLPYISYSPNSTQENQEISSEISQEKTYDLSFKEENNTVNESIEQHERKINDLNAKVENLNKQIMVKDTLIDNMTFQVKYYKDLKIEDDKQKKQLEFDNTELLRSIEEMKDRYKKQFMEYEKLLKKAREETDLEKREITRLREHFSVFPSFSPIVGKQRRISNSNHKSTSDVESCESIINVVDSGTPAPTIISEILSETPNSRVTTQESEATSEQIEPNKKRRGRPRKNNPPKK